MLVQADWALLDAIQRLRSPAMDFLMPGVTFLGTLGWFWIVTGGMLIAWKRTRACGVAILLALLTAQILGNVILKPLVARERPFADRPDIRLIVPPETSYSFPSGHTITGFAAAAAIACGRFRWRWAGYPAAVLIAFSRLYLYLHFPSDVLAAIILGTGCGLLAHTMVSAVSRRLRRKGDPPPVPS